MSNQQGPGKPGGPPGPFPTHRGHGGTPQAPPQPQPQAQPYPPAQPQPYPPPQQAQPYPPPQPQPYPPAQAQPYPPPQPYPPAQAQPYPPPQPYPQHAQPYPQPYPPPQAQPYPPPQPAQPYPPPQPAPPPFAAQAQPYPAAPQGWQPPGPPPGAPAMPPPAQPPPAAVAAYAGGASPTTPPPESGMFGRSISRAFRLRIEPNEVSPAEKRALEAATPPITDPHMQAFLAWRRSLLFLVAVALVPLAALRLLDAMKDDWPDELRFIALIPAIAEVFLCVVCWVQLKHWSHWRRQRRALFKAWVIFMAAPFLVFLVPVDGIIEDVIRNQLGVEGAAIADPTALATTLKVAISVMALLTLAPKAVSLLAGTIRAGIVTKMLFPGTAGPGWIVVLSTPIYTLFVFTLLIVPYQITGSGWYLGAMLALMLAQVVLGRAGYQLAKPTSHEDAVRLVAKARGAYLLSMLGFAVCMVVALGTMAQQLGVETIITTVLSFEANVLLLTLIGSDLVITNLDRARGLSSGTSSFVDDSNKKLEAFVGSE